MVRPRPNSTAQLSPHTPSRWRCLPISPLWTIRLLAGHGDHSCCPSVHWRDLSKAAWILTPSEYHFTRYFSITSAWQNRQRKLVTKNAWPKMAVKRSKKLPLTLVPKLRSATHPPPKALRRSAPCLADPRNQTTRAPAHNHCKRQPIKSFRH